MSPIRVTPGLGSGFDGYTEGMLVTVVLVLCAIALLVFIVRR
jgi:hypothetical protein